MRAQIVEDDYVARQQARHQDLADIDLEHIAGHSPVEDPRFAQAAEAERTDKGIARATTTRRGFDHSFAGRCPAIETCHTQMRTGFIDEFQAWHRLRVHPRVKVLAERLDARRVALAVVDGLFFSGSFSSCSSRETILWLARI